MATERRKGMSEIIEAINTLREELHVYVVKSDAQFEKLSACDETRTKDIGNMKDEITRKLSTIDETIRGNGKKGLIERVSGLETSQKVIIGVLVPIGLGLLAFILDNVLGHVFP